MQIMQDIQTFFKNALTGVGITDLIDILIVAFIVYKVLGFIRTTRAEQLVKGLLVLIAATFLSGIFNLYTLNWILKGAMTLGAVALVIVFQPELRRGLEYLGRSKIVKAPFGQMDKERAKYVTAQVIDAVEAFSKDRIGALLILEGETALADISESGTILDAKLSSELLKNIFYVGSPLHDGAVIIREDRILAAGCVLPLSQNKTIGKDLGTRHRAGIGITEHSDAVVLIVSEETGIISMASDGVLSRFLDTKTVEKTLLNLYLNQNEGGRNLPFNFLKRIRRRKDAEK